MKTVLKKSGGVLCIAVLGISQAFADEPKSGTQEAALAVAQKFVELIYVIPASSLNATVVKSDADWVTVKVAAPTKACTLSLVKNATANQQGWVVSTHECKQ